MAKKPEDFISDLAKVQPSPRGFKPIARRPQSRFPKGLVLLVVGGMALFGFIKYFTSHNPSQILASVEKHLPTKALITVKPSTAKLTHAHEVSPRSPAAQKAVSQYVYIDGKMYKRSPNNTYIVNGHRLFYVNNR